MRLIQEGALSARLSAEACNCAGPVPSRKVARESAPPEFHYDADGQFVLSRRKYVRGAGQALAEARARTRRVSRDLMREAVFFFSTPF